MISESTWSLIPNTSKDAFSAKVVKSSSASGKTLTNIKLGKSASTTNNDFGGDLAELLIFSRQLTNSEEQKLEGYLAHRWGATSSLDSNHPYKSVAPIFEKQRATGSLTITNPEMTRFLLPIKQGVEFVFKSLEGMVGGELFIPKIPSCTVGEIAKLIAPKCEWDVIGLRPGEKMHETLIPEDESRNVLEFDDHFVIKPIKSFWGNKIGIIGGKECCDGFVYASNKNSEHCTESLLKDMLQDFIQR